MGAESRATWHAGREREVSWGGVVTVVICRGASVCGVGGDCGVGIVNLAVVVVRINSV